MNKRFQSWFPGATLLLLGLLAGVGWRAELEMRSGWHGLAWITYFHWAVPLSVVGFVAWAGYFAPVRCRIAFIAALSGAAVLGHFVAGVALWLFFITGPSAGMFAAWLGNGDFELGLRRFEMLRWAAIIAWLLIPLSFCFLCRLFGASITLSRAVCAMVLFTASWQLAMIVRGIFESHGASDLIHALKSGFVVPFLIASLGLPLLHVSLRNKEASGSTDRA